MYSEVPMHKINTRVCKVNVIISKCKYFVPLGENSSATTSAWFRVNDFCKFYFASLAEWSKPQIHLVNYMIIWCWSIHLLLVAARHITRYEIWIWPCSEFVWWFNARKSSKSLWSCNLWVLCARSYSQLKPPHDKTFFLKKIEKTSVEKCID